METITKTSYLIEEKELMDLLDSYLCLDGVQRSFRQDKSKNAKSLIDRIAKVRRYIPKSVRQNFKLINEDNLNKLERDARKFTGEKYSPKIN